MRHASIRISLFVLQTFVALTALDGALFVVPALPVEWLEGGPFTDYTLPAMALALVVGGTAIAALLALLVRPDLAGLASVSAGIVIIVFELVEIAAVGLAVVDRGWAEPMALLQVLYLVVGVVEIVLGYALVRATDAALGHEGTSH